MKNITPIVKVFIGMFLLWMLLNFNLNLITIIFGILVSILVSFLTYGILYDESGFVYRGIKIHFLFMYIFVLIGMIFKSAFLFIINMFKSDYVPIVFRIVLNLDDPIKVAIIANTITLTPGTITIDIEDNAIVVMVLAKKDTPPKLLEKQIRDKYEKLFISKEKRL